MPARASHTRPAEPDLSRIVSRISSAYFMRSLRLLADLHDGEIVTAIVCQAIATANTAHVDQADEGVHFGGEDSSPPDELRRPVSILAISEGLGMSFETTRRHVNRLSARGRCVRVKKGVIVPRGAVDEEGMEALRHANLANVRRMVRELRRIGLDAD